jgi:hypothetical protein
VTAPTYPLATTRVKALTIASWLVDQKICKSRAEALELMIAERELTVRAYEQWQREVRCDEAYPPCEEE